MRIVFISDTHGLHARVAIPEGDVLVHAGDLTGHGTVDEIRALDGFLAGLPHRHKIIIAGNHDWAFEREPDEARRAVRHAIYLQDEAVEIDGLRFYGSPWQPWFLDWAFNLPRGEALREVWSRIPDDTDVLVTHGPPLQILDRCYDGRHVGCEALREAVLERVRPRVHVFGHIHEAWGRFDSTHTTFINASICTLDYQPIQQPFVLELVPRPATSCA